MDIQYSWIIDQKICFFLFLIAWKVGQENIAEIITKHHSTKLHKFVCPFYLHTDKTPRSVLLVFLQPDLQGYVDSVYSKMEEFCKALLIPQIACLRGSRTRTTDIRMNKKIQNVIM